MSLIDSEQRSVQQGQIENPLTPLSLDQLKEISLQLPDPNKQEKIGPAVFDIYRAKDRTTIEFNSTPMKMLVQEARRTYHVLYGGDIPLIDPYDDKSDIYLVRVTYPHSDPTTRGKNFFSVQV